MKIKKIFMRIILSLEIFAFMYLYMYGKNGFQLVHIQTKELTQLEAEITHLQKEICFLEHDIDCWCGSDFYKEKIAREQLQMARKDDKLFFITS